MIELELELDGDEGALNEEKRKVHQV